MTKEELKQEAEEWVKDHSGLIGSYEYVKYDYDSLIQAYLASAEPREKRIEELEELNKELFSSLCNHDRDLLLVNNRIAELEKENAELKEINTHTLSQLNLDNGELITQLTKAKNLLQKVADVCGYPNYDIPIELYLEIADFLKDSEV